MGLVTMRIDEINWTWVENELFCLLHGEMDDSLPPLAATRKARHLAEQIAGRVKLVLHCQAGQQEPGEEDTICQPGIRG